MPSNSGAHWSGNPRTRCVEGDDVLVELDPRLVGDALNAADELGEPGRQPWIVWRSRTRSRRFSTRRSCSTASRITFAITFCTLSTANSRTGVEPETVRYRFVHCLQAGDLDERARRRLRKSCCPLRPSTKQASTSTGSSRDRNGTASIRGSKSFATCHGPHRGPNV